MLGVGIIGHSSCVVNYYGRSGGKGVIVQVVYASTPLWRPLRPPKVALPGNDGSTHSDEQWGRELSSYSRAGSRNLRPVFRSSDDGGDSRSRGAQCWPVDWPLAPIGLVERLVVTRLPREGLRGGLHDAGGGGGDHRHEGSLIRGVRSWARPLIRGVRSWARPYLRSRVPVRTRGGGCRSAGRSRSRGRSGLRASPAPRARDPGSGLG
jgi:hypothetical protein